MSAEGGERRVQKLRILSLVIRGLQTQSGPPVPASGSLSRTEPEGGELTTRRSRRPHAVSTQFSPSYSRFDLKIHVSHYGISGRYN